MQRTDDQLVTAYLEDEDQGAFQELVERHKDRIYGYLLGMVHERAVADDLFQETFFRVISALHKQRGNYSSQGKWIHWAMRIARNAALDHLRSRKRWRPVESSDPDSGEDILDRLPDLQPDAIELLASKENMLLLERCIGELSPEQREVLLLRHDAGLTFKEIAAMTDCSINTALGRMRYALINLRRLMDESQRHDIAPVG